MRKIILSMLVTLDGFISRPDGEMDWRGPDEAVDQYAVELLKNTVTIIMGRRAYDLFSSYWPTAPDDPSLSKNNVEFAKLINAMPKVVYSKTMETAGWHNTIVKNKIDREDITALKQMPGKDIVVFGGAQLAQNFIREDLIDEYRLLIHPVILGKGKALFGATEEQLKLKLVDTKAYASSTILLIYQR